jgi:hypothetical protein
VGANDKGDFVGSYQFPNDPNTHGFAYINGAYVSADNTTGIFGINNAGVMVGHSNLAPQLGAVIVVPEPSTMALFVGSAGLFGLAHARRSKDQSKPPP